MRLIAYRVRGWNIVIWSALTIGLLFTFILIVNGINEPSLRIAIRATARTSCILFTLAFCASALRRLQSNPLTIWLLHNRRYLGLAMAVSHVYHAIAIAGVAILTSENMVADNYGATLGYVFILLMTITSFPRPAAWLGRPNWRILHTIGMYYLWLSFIYAFSQKLNESLLMYVPFVGLLTIAIVLRLIPVDNSQENQ